MRISGWSSGVCSSDRPVQATGNPDGTFRVFIEQDETKKRYVDYAIPSEEFLFSARTRHEDDADYSAHRSRKSLSELVAMGFARDTVAGLTEHDEAAITESWLSASWNDETLTANDPNLEKKEQRSGGTKGVSASEYRVS